MWCDNLKDHIGSQVNILQKLMLMLFSLCVLDFPEGFVAGGTAGVVVETALYPIDTIKTRLQAG